MSYGYSPVIPLQRNAEDGFYVLTKTIAQNIQQNFKNLLLTSPGERVMIPDFGVGLRAYLFENLSFEVQSNITERIENQVSEFMPFLNIDEMDFFDHKDAMTGLTENVLAIRIFYSIPSQGISDMLTISKDII